MTEHKHTNQTVSHNTGTPVKLFHTTQVHQSNCFTQYRHTNQTVSQSTGKPIELFHTVRPAHINYTDTTNMLQSKKPTTFTSDIIILIQ
jgi:hypothetical protein